MKTSLKRMAATVAAAVLDPAAAHAGTRFAPATADTGQVYEL